MRLKFNIDYKGLEAYLTGLDRSEIETNWNKPEKPKLMEGKAMDDIEFFKLDKSTIAPEKIIDYGTPFLVDALGNDLSVVLLTKRKYKLPNGRLVRAKYISTVIKDCRELYGTPLNGYWKIPSEFIKPLMAKKLKIISRGYRGKQNKYQYGETIFVTDRTEYGFYVFDQAKGIADGQHIFKTQNYDYFFAMQKFKAWLLTSTYTVEK